MPESKPVNDLERALAAAMKSEVAIPDLYRHLLSENLWFLMPFHPEMEGAVEMKPGMPVAFSAWNSPDLGAFVPLFSSQERAAESLERTGQPERRYAFASTGGRAVLTMLAAQKAMAILNPACASTGEVRMPLELIAALADGSLLRPFEEDPEAPQDDYNDSAEMTILDPADYPMGLIQPLFEFMRRHANFRKGWIFGEGLPTSPVPGTYRLVIWMDPRDAQIEKDLRLVMRSLETADRHCLGMVVDEKEVANFPWVPHIPAFYTAQA